MSNDKTDFKVGDQVLYIYDGDEGFIMSIDDDSRIRVEFEDDGGCVVGPGDIELVSGNSEEATRNRAKSFTETVSDFSPAVSPEDIENISRLGDALGIYPSSFEGNVRRITDQIADLLIAKNKQYSNSALDPIRVFSKADRMEQLRVRADDKLSRIRNGDTSEDAVLDLCGYLILMKIAEESA